MCLNYLTARSLIVYAVVAGHAGTHAGRAHTCAVRAALVGLSNSFCPAFKKGVQPGTQVRS